MNGILSGHITYPQADTDHAMGLVPTSLADHRARWGQRPTVDGRLLDLVDQANLRGRGGGYFPAATKWRSAMAGQVDTVVANAAESEPASVKDAALWQSSPHLILDGLQSTAEAVGARRAVVWLHAGSRATSAAIARARAERVASGEYGVEVEVVTAPARYLSGESSAIIRSLRGGPAIPGFSPRGVRAWGKGPAILVHNTETLARVGTLDRVVPASLGTTLITVAYASQRTAFEIPTGVTFNDVLTSIERPQAVLLGGYGGQWVNWESIANLPIEYDALAQRGLRLGAGVIAPLPHDVCGLRETSRIVSWMAGQSARQCGPCLYGLAQIDEDLRLIVGLRGARKAAKALREHLDLVIGRGACSHPDGVVGLVHSALTTFAGEVESHIHGRCTAGYQRPVLPLPEDHLL